MAKEQKDIQGIQRNWPDYTVEEVLGKGAYGIVYKIKREYLGNTIYSALKVIHIPPDEENRRELQNLGMTDHQIKEYYKGQVNNFLNENNVMEKLKGASNIVTIEDCRVENEEGSDSYIIYIKMELLESLDTILKTYKPSEDVIVKIGMDICEALSACEQMNIIHRDIKLSNVFMNSFNTFKLGDFGIARQMEGMKTRGMTQVGTTQYMAPELYITGKADHRADIYSLGIMLYRLANRGYFPFVDPDTVSPESNQNAMMRRLMGEKLPPLDKVDPELSRIIIKACEKDINQRYQHAKDMRRDLKKWESMKEIDAYVNSNPSRETAEREKLEREKKEKAERERKEQEEKARRREQERKDREALIAERIRRQQEESSLQPAPRPTQPEEKTAKLEKKMAQPAKNLTKPEKDTVQPLKKQKKSGKGVLIGAIAAVAVLVILGFVMFMSGEKYTPGEVIEFGNYNGHKLEWIVLSVKKDQALIITKDVLPDLKEYKDNGGSAEWESSTLNDWLNSEFFGQHFSGKEQKSIEGTIELLSVSDVKKYLPQTEDRKATTGSGEQVWWWLKNPSKKNDKCAACVDQFGQINEYGGLMHLQLGVRPAMWIK